MSRSVEEALANCLERLETGDMTPEEAASLYPELRAELQPLLDLAAELRAMPRVEAPASLRGYKRPAFRPAPVREAWWRRLLPASGRSLNWATPLAQAAAVLAILLLAVGGTVVASASSLPDEPLFPVKLAVENAQLALAPSDHARAELELRFAANRLAEVESAAQQGRVDAVEKGAALYSQKVDAAVQASGGDAGPVGPEVEAAVRQNDVALNKVLDKVENPNARAAISAAIERTQAASGESKGPKDKDKDGQNTGKPNDKSATAAVVTAPAAPSATPTATPAATATPASPADTHEPPGKAKGHTEGPGNSDQANPDGQESKGQGNPQGQEPKGQGQNSRQTAPVQDAPQPAATAVRTATPTPTPPGARGSEMGNGNGPQKPDKDSESTTPDNRGQQKKDVDKEVQKNDFLGGLLDGIRSLVTHRR